MLTLRVDLADDEIEALDHELGERAKKIVAGSVGVRPQDRAIAKLLEAVHVAASLAPPRPVPIPVRKVSGDA